MDAYFLVYKKVFGALLERFGLVMPLKICMMGILNLKLDFKSDLASARLKLHGINHSFKIFRFPGCKGICMYSCFM